jgi:predicted transposase YdaD
MGFGIKNSHDKFFKETFSNKEEAIDLLRNALPKQLLDKVNLTSLQLDNSSYIDEELKESFSDLVFDCKYKGETNIKIAILIEHKSYVPAYPHIQLLKYMIKIWDVNIKQKQKLVPVVPLIFYHGKEKWRPRKFHQYFEGYDQDLAPFLPSFLFLLTDLSSYSEAEIRNIYNAITVQMSLLLMKSIFDEEKVYQDLPTIFSGVGQIVETERGVKFFMSILLYIYSNTEVEPGIITKTINKISTKGGEIAMTTAMKLEKKGKLEGKLELSYEIAKRLIKRKMSVNEISAITELPEKDVEKIMRTMLSDQKRANLEK